MNTDLCGSWPGRTVHGTGPSARARALARIVLLMIAAGVVLLVAASVFAGTSAVPDPGLTPGAVLTTDATKVCRAGYARTVRHVTEATKREVFRRYGIRCTACGKRYEVDHLISLELGGSNEVTNLFPQPYEPRPGAHEKDLVENWLHAEVCSGRMGLPEAQHEIAMAWLSVWKRMPKTGPAFHHALVQR
jgi:hypothetical protein